MPARDGQENAVSSDLSRLTVREQLAEFRRLVLLNPYIGKILRGAVCLDLPGWYLTAGCLFQTVWNALSGRDPAAGIRDYDLFYFDDTNLSWEAEDLTIRRAAEVFADVGVGVEVRNEARVHLWYERKFGVPCSSHRSSEAAIDSFAATTCCYGVRLVGDELEVYAPHGFGDLFGFVLRPNPVLAPREVYENKARRWSAEWPKLAVMRWPA
ncbi:MAG TPA: nucleotidyltransferase family protein [Rubrobacter sp.]|nr:nucleotidyltransferase family protein [Rubrobacter sp.]